MIEVTAKSDEAIGGVIKIAQAPLPDEKQDFPQPLIDFLVDIRLLGRVPFRYIVPHEEMLPLESIRFFYLNRNWLDAAVDGALSLGAATTRDRMHLESLYADLRKALDAAERKVWADRTGTQPQEGEAEVVSGFLLRSKVVSGWPALHVRASRTVDGAPVDVRILRLERVAPAILLVLFDGVPDAVHVEEPRVAAQFGVDPDGNGRSVIVRDPDTGDELPGGVKAQVPFRSGAPGVIDMTALRKNLVDAAGGELGTGLSSAELGLQLLQYPFRQVFGQTDAPLQRVFLATIKMSEVRSSHEL